MNHLDTAQPPVELAGDLEDGELLDGLDAGHQEALQGQGGLEHSEHLRRVHRHRDVVRGAVGDGLRLNTTL